VKLLLRMSSISAWPKRPPALKLQNSKTRQTQRKRGNLPAFFFASCTRNLPPVPFHKHPAIVMMDPPVRHPNRAGMRRTVPTAGNPHIAVAVPVMVARNPHVPAFRRWRPALNDRGRRSNANHNLRKRNCRRQTKGKKKCHQRFFHRNSILQAICRFPEPERPGVLVVRNHCPRISCTRINKMR